MLASIALDEGDEAPPGAVLGVHRRSGAAASADANRSRTRAPADRSKHRLPADAAKVTRLSPLVRRLLVRTQARRSRRSRGTRPRRAHHAQGRRSIPSRAAKSQRRRRSPPATASQGRRIPHDAMRKSIAEHMSRSVATAPHVTAVFEADFSAIAAHRAKHKAALCESRRAAHLLRLHRARGGGGDEGLAQRQRRWHDDFLEVFEDANIGMGVALGDKGLIVPVIAARADAVAAGNGRAAGRSHRARAQEQAQARRRARRHVHDLQSRRLRLARRRRRSSSTSRNRRSWASASSKSASSCARSAATTRS